jgi:hypothetical protein
VEDTLISASKNGMIVLWNLYSNSIIKIPHYIKDQIVRLEVINEKTFLAITNKYKIYIFQKLKSKISSKVVSVSFECRVIMNLELDSKIDRIISSCRVMKKLWLGTAKGRILIIDFIEFCNLNHLKIEDFYLDIRNII